MSFPFDNNDMMFPGLDSVLDTVQNQFWWGRESQQRFLPATIVSSALDAGNTVTTTLRGGLLLGRITTTGKLKQWNPTGTDGSEVIVGLLPAPLTPVDGGTVADRYTYVYVGGNLLSDRILIPGEAVEGIVGHALEFQIVNQLVGRGFFLDKHYQYGPAFGGSRFVYLTAAQITADAVTVTTAQHGRTFLMTGADGNTTFTLPAAQVGLTYHFYNNVATYNIVIALASGTLSKAGDSAATAVTLGPGEAGTFVGVAAGQYQLIGSEATD